MAHTIQAPAYNIYQHAEYKVSLWKRFTSWATAEDAQNHFLWTAAGIMLQGAVLFPASMFAILFVNPVLWIMMLPIAGIAMVVASNLAALPTKFTIPVLFLSILLDIVAVIACFLV